MLVSEPARTGEGLLGARPDEHTRFGDMVGASVALKEVWRQIEMVAPTDSTVLIHGETGTGKELVARAIHNLGSRRHRPFVRLNVAAIPHTLMESELFGHERGAFTGANLRRIGRFEMAHDGTLFMDEVGELGLDLQPKLLRVLQEREFERLGGRDTLPANARVVAATNRDLSAMAEAGSFRTDLFYRLSVFPIRVPALRERPADIRPLVEHIVRGLSRRLGKEIRVIPPATMANLEAHPWPGNIRQLQNVLERSVIVAEGSTLDVQLPVGEGVPNRPESTPDRQDVLKDVERAHILRVLHKTNWVIAGPHGAAARLGMKRTTLHFRMRKLGISRDGRGEQPAQG